MNVAEQRKYGVNFFTVLKAARSLFTDPEFLPTGMTDIAEKILEKILGFNKETALTRGIDWDALIKFIEILLPLILKIIDIIISLV